MENGVMMQYFEWNLPNDGKLWKKLRNDACHLHSLGITAVWTPPASKASEQKNPGYAAYDLYDLGEFYQKGTVRTKYGTKRQLLNMIATLHQYHISVYFDAVLNHKIGADRQERFLAIEVDKDDRTLDISEAIEIEGWTQFEFDGRKKSHSSLQWHSHHFTGLEIKDKDGVSHIYRVAGKNKHWSEDVDTENGNFDFLMGADIDHRHPEVIADLNQWGLWMTHELQVDGIRLDAIKHISRRFIHQFISGIREQRGKQFYFVGEYWTADLETLGSYLQGVEDSIDLFDVPLHFHFHEASILGKQYDLRDLFEGSLVSTRPSHAVTFVDNHDSQKGSSLESEVKSWFKPLAYALILLRKEGYPCIFYGDYYGINGEKSPHRKTLDLLLWIRKECAYGEERLYFDTPNTIGFIRDSDEEHPDSGVVVLLCNSEKSSINIDLGLDKAREEWVEITQTPHTRTQVSLEGTAEFPVPASSMSIWIRKSKFQQKNAQKHSKKRLSIARRQTK